jgi:hypothetical protein
MWSHLCPNGFALRENVTGNNWKGGWMGLITSLDDKEKRTLPHWNQISTLGYSEFRLSYLGTLQYK